MTKNNPSHWSYIGGAEYAFAGVCVTRANGLWHMNTTVSDTDQYKHKKLNLDVKSFCFQNREQKDFSYTYFL